MEKNLESVESRITQIHQMYEISSSNVIDVTDEAESNSNEKQPITKTSRLSSFLSDVFSSKPKLSDRETSNSPPSTFVQPNLPATQQQEQPRPTQQQIQQPRPTVQQEVQPKHTRRRPKESNQPNSETTNGQLKTKPREPDKSVLQGVDTAMANMILNDIVVNDLNVSWDDVGL